MSNIYQTFDPELPNYETPSDGIGSPGLNERDIDQQIAYSTPDGNNYYDYDVLSTPTASGPQLIVPSIPDDGMPTFSSTEVVDYTIQAFKKDGITPCGPAGGDDEECPFTRMEPKITSVYQMDSAIMGDSTASLSEMTDVVNNGRVSDVGIVNQRFVSEDADVVIQKDNQVNSIKGILEENALNSIFFSDMNMDAIQKSIRYNVYNATNQVVGFQPEHTLYIIMRSIMLQYGNFKVSAENLLDEILELNQRVVNYSAGNISSNVQQYIGYIDDIQKLPTPMEHPSYQNKQNYTYDISNLI
tara:strand:- start:1209 stop:2108 length:900 start_codon:yes stop_codon:yes gene_type:complete